MNVVFELLPHPAHREPRVRAVVQGMSVVWRMSTGWRCRCGKTAGPKRCRHVRALQRELPDVVREQVEAYSEPLGWKP